MCKAIFQCANEFFLLLFECLSFDVIIAGMFLYVFSNKSKSLINRLLLRWGSSGVRVQDGEMFCLQKDFGGCCGSLGKSAIQKIVDNFCLNRKILPSSNGCKLIENGYGFVNSRKYLRFQHF